tara:strand:+ start:2089 stop:3093 length:1005 start_codon:yes stop_codon:yes gene_type:complete
MRFVEFRENNKKPLFEYDANIPDQELKDLIVQRLQTEDDRNMLDKIYQALEASTLDERIKETLGQDTDAKSRLQIFAGMVMNTEGTYAEKQEFIDNYAEGYIDTQKLTTPNQIHQYGEWIVGPPFVERVYDQLYTYTPQGIGPGEYALAVLSPRISASGRSAEMAGDLVIDGAMCEVKAKQQSGGRFSDNRKAKMNIRATEQAFNKLGIEVGKGISGLMFARDIRPQLDPKDLATLCKIIVDNAFSFVSKGQKGALVTALEGGDGRQIAHEWGMLSFHNYKLMSKFETMLLLDGPKRHSLYFTDINNVSAVINAGQPYVVGPEQQIHPQMTFKI